MADDPASDSFSPPEGAPASGPGGSPLDELEAAAAGGGDPFGGEDPFAGGDPFGGQNPFGNEPPALMMAKFWIRQNALLSLGVAFAAGTLIGVLKR